MPLGGGKKAIARSRDFTTSRLKEWKKKNEREQDWREPSLTGTYRGRPSMLKETLNRNNISIEDVCRIAKSKNIQKNISKKVDFVI